MFWWFSNIAEVHVKMTETQITMLIFWFIFAQNNFHFQFTYKNKIKKIIWILQNPNKELGFLHEINIFRHETHA